MMMIAKKRPFPFYAFNVPVRLSRGQLSSYISRSFYSLLAPHDVDEDIKYFVLPSVVSTDKMQTRKKRIGRIVKKKCLSKQQTWRRTKRRWGKSEFHPIKWAAHHLFLQLHSLFLHDTSTVNKQVRLLFFYDQNVWIKTEYFVRHQTCKFS